MMLIPDDNNRICNRHIKFNIQITTKKFPEIVY